MIELSEKEIRAENRKSSKGNQLKWLHGDTWYKADYAGYEGLAEYAVSQLLLYSNLQSSEFVIYQTEEIRYRRQILKGCSEFSSGGRSTSDTGENVSERLRGEPVQNGFPNSRC